MKTPLSLLAAILALAATAASAEGGSCNVNWGKLRPDDIKVQLPKLKPIAVSSCADVEKLPDPETFWKVRLAMIGLPPRASGAPETVTSDKLPQAVKDVVAGGQAGQYLSVGERVRVNAILAGPAMCNALAGGC